jgi:hypothetical protein
MSLITYNLYYNQLVSNGGGSTSTPNTSTIVRTLDVSSTAGYNFMGSQNNFDAGFYCAAISNNPQSTGGVYFTNVIQVANPPTRLNGTYFVDKGFVWNNADQLTGAPYVYTPFSLGSVYEYTGGANSGVTAYAFNNGGSMSVQLMTHNIATPYSIAITSSNQFAYTVEGESTYTLVFVSNQSASNYNVQNPMAFKSYGSLTNGVFTSYPPGYDLLLSSGSPVAYTITDVNGGSYSTTLTPTTQYPPITTATFVFNNQSIDYGNTNPQFVINGNAIGGMHIVAESLGLLATDVIRNVSFFDTGAYNSATVESDWNNTTGGTLRQTTTSNLAFGFNANSSEDLFNHPRPGRYYYAVLTYERTTNPSQGQDVTYTLKSNVVIFA